MIEFFRLAVLPLKTDSSNPAGGGKEHGISSRLVIRQHYRPSPF